jgi:putative transposase
VLDILIQKRRDARAAKRFFRRLAKQYGQPRVLATDKLRGYGVAVRSVTPDADHRAHKGLNNRIEVSHQPTRKREKITGRLKSLRQAQRFLANHDQINVAFRPRRYRLSATSYRHVRNDAFALWSSYTAEISATA